MWGLCTIVSNIIVKTKQEIKQLKENIKEYKIEES
jgi:hypothetical protein